MIMNWIPCKERLPEFNINNNRSCTDNIIFSSHEGWVSYGCFDNSYFEDDEDGEPYAIWFMDMDDIACCKVEDGDAWMPLPEPYDKNKEDGDRIVEV